MVRKIITSGTDAVASGAREASERLQLPLGGITGDASGGTTGGRDPDEDFRRGVVEADATVLIARGEGGTRAESIRRICQQAGEPLFQVDLKKTGGFQAARQLSEWVDELKVAVLHVVGTGDDQDPDLTRRVRDLLEALFYLNLMNTDGTPAAPAPVFLEEEELPRTVTDAAARLAKQLPLKDKTTIANMSESELPGLDPTLGEYIRNAFRLWSGNYALLDSCRWLARKEGAAETDAASVILRELWKELRKTHTLRVIK